MKLLLKTSFVAGAAGVVIIAPNSAQAFNYFIKQTDKNHRRNKRFTEQARRSGYFEIEQLRDNRYAIKLTAKGDKTAKNLLYDDYTIPKPKKWDGNWHLFMFDINEQNKYLRDTIKNKIMALGMLPLQNSVYVYPYPIDEFVQNLHNTYPQATQFVIQVDAYKIDGQTQIVEKFRKNKVL